MDYPGNEFFSLFVLIRPLLISIGLSTANKDLGDNTG